MRGNNKHHTKLKGKTKFNYKTKLEKQNMYMFLKHVQMQQTCTLTTVYTKCNDIIFAVDQYHIVSQYQCTYTCVQVRLAYLVVL